MQVFDEKIVRRFRPSELKKTTTSGSCLKSKS